MTRRTIAGELTFNAQRAARLELTRRLEQEIVESIPFLGIGCIVTVLDCGGDPVARDMARGAPMPYADGVICSTMNEHRFVAGDYVDAVAARAGIEIGSIKTAAVLVVAHGGRSLFQQRAGRLVEVHEADVDEDFTHWSTEARQVLTFEAAGLADQDTGDPVEPARVDEVADLEPIAAE